MGCQTTKSESLIYKFWKLHSVAKIQVKNVYFAFTILSAEPFLILSDLVNPGSFDVARFHQENMINFTARIHLFRIGQPAFKEWCNAHPFFQNT